MYTVQYNDADCRVSEYSSPFRSRIFSIMYQSNTLCSPSLCHANARAMCTCMASLCYSIPLILAADAKPIDHGMRQISCADTIWQLASFMRSKILSVSQIVEQTYVHIDNSWKLYNLTSTDRGRRKMLQQDAVRKLQHAYKLATATLRIRAN
jgi:hypothetical protein